jgi:predicted transcriptional regulator of viral defense system
MGTSLRDKILDRAREAGVLRPRDLEGAGIPGTYLARLARRGLLVRVGRGLYALPGAPAGEHQSLAEAAKRVPRGVVCLLSALRYHGLTTQSPFEVWMAIGEKDRRPKADGQALRIVRYSPQALRAGVETRDIGGVRVRIFSPAKTVADCFKYRNKIGIDVAIEALKDCVQRRRCSVDELVRYARICRVWNVMRPYMEAVE